MEYIYNIFGIITIVLVVVMVGGLCISLLGAHRYGKIHKKELRDHNGRAVSFLSFRRNTGKSGCSVLSETSIKLFSVIHQVSCQPQ